MMPDLHSRGAVLAPAGALLLAAALVAGVPGAAHAALLGTCPADQAQSIDGATAAACFDSGMDNDLGAMSVVQDADGLFGITSWLRASSTDGSAALDLMMAPNFGVAPDNTLAQGYFWVQSALFDVWDSVMMFFKDGVGSVAVLLDPVLGHSDVDEDDFSPGGTAFVTNEGVLGLGCNQLDDDLGGVTGADCAGDWAGVFAGLGAAGAGELSHASLYVASSDRAPPTEVPAPGGLALFAVGLLGLFAAGRRRT